MRGRKNPMKGVLVSIEFTMELFPSYAAGFLFVFHEIFFRREASRKLGRFIWVKLLF